jgi:hypothetical protein
MVTIASLKIQLADANAKLAKAKGGQQFKTRLSDKTDDDGIRKVIVYTGVQNYPVTLAVAGWEAILSEDGAEVIRDAIADAEGS